MAEKEGFPIDLARKPSSGKAEDDFISEYETCAIMSDIKEHEYMKLDSERLN